MPSLTRLHISEGVEFFDPLWRMIQTSAKPTELILCDFQAHFFTEIAGEFSGIKVLCLISAEEWSEILIDLIWGQPSYYFPFLQTLELHGTGFNGEKSISYLTDIMESRSTVSVDQQSDSSSSPGSLLVLKFSVVEFMLNDESVIQLFTLADKLGIDAEIFME
ncbi:hypothetical protein BDQ17DRAFT_1354939 [Cyathus striatus]|nr:hypothetical protein BDQ17DRAFT_1354939 [Cyathus striatus]